MHYRKMQRLQNLMENVLIKALFPWGFKWRNLILISVENKSKKAHEKKHVYFPPPCTTVNVTFEYFPGGFSPRIARIFLRIYCSMKRDTYWFIQILYILYFCCTSSSWTKHWKHKNIQRYLNVGSIYSLRMWKRKIVSSFHSRSSGATKTTLRTLSATASM